MEISKSTNGTLLIVSVSGKLDSNTAVAFEKELDNILATEMFNNLEINMEELTYLSSAGLRVLLKIQKKLMSLEAGIVITNVNENIKSVFEITGFLGILNII